MGFHQCKRFRDLGFSFCPLAGFEEHEDDEEEPTPDDDAILPPASAAEEEIGLATPAIVQATTPLARTIEVRDVVKALMEGAGGLPLGKLLNVDATSGAEIGAGVVDAVAKAFVPQEVLDIVRDAREDQRGEPSRGVSREIEGEQEGPGLLEAARAAAVVAGVTTLAHKFVGRSGGAPGGVIEKAVTQQIKEIIRAPQEDRRGRPNITNRPPPNTVVAGGGKHKNVSQQFVPDNPDIFGDFMIGVGEEIWQRGAG